MSRLLAFTRYVLPLFPYFPLLKGTSDYWLPNHSRLGSCSTSNAMRNDDLGALLRSLPWHLLELPLHTYAWAAVCYLPIHDSVSGYQNIDALIISAVNFLALLEMVFTKQSEEGTTPTHPSPTSKPSHHHMPSNVNQPKILISLYRSETCSAITKGASPTAPQLSKASRIPPPNGKVLLPNRLISFQHGLAARPSQYRAMTHLRAG